MFNSALAIIIGVVAAAILGVLAEWLLKRFLPDHLNLKRTIVVIVVIGVLIFFIVLPSLLEPRPVEYTGRIFDNTTGLPIEKAKVLLDVENNTSIVDTDSRGIYRFVLSINKNASGRLRVEADSYENYNLYITLLPETPTIEEIRLNPVGGTAATPIPTITVPNPTPAPTPTTVISTAVTPIPTIVVPLTITQEGDVTELNILWAQWDPANYLQEVGNLYEKEFGIKVNVIQEPWSSFSDRFFNAMSVQGTSYDMVVGQSQWLGYGSTQGHYLELTDFLRETGTADTVTPAALTYYSEYPTNSDHYWAYPTEGDAVGWAYRKDLFEDPEEQAAFKENYGYALAPPETLEQLMDIAKFFTRPDNGLYGVAIYTQTDYEGITWGFQNILFSYGGDWKDANNNAVGVINSPKAVTALEYYKELYRCCQAPGLSNAYFAETNDAFIGGQVAMAMNFFTFLPALVNPVVSPYAEQTGFFINPAGPDGQQYATRGGQNISIISHISPDRQEAAKHFIQWFAQEKIQAEWARFGGYTCNIKVLQSQEFLNATPFNPAYAKTMVFIKDFWNIPVYDQLLRITQSKLSNYVVGGQGTAQEVLDSIAEQHQQILKKGGFITEK